ncbi:hypothetical protein CRG98_024557 [Punica granatum]|uniref:Uncharacterized protein n=1 Tax=Punica granatum TaxID=22663 RepID=A0A2I0JGL2_PUNGR|nr:hypothetical protein CRG98_024557 [Punica granatum]
MRCNGGGQHTGHHRLKRCHQHPQGLPAMSLGLRWFRPTIATSNLLPPLSREGVREPGLRWLVARTIARAMLSAILEAAGIVA